jgi:hypothetical protein
LYKANIRREESEQVGDKEFQNEALNNRIGLQDQYVQWVEQKAQLQDADQSFVNVNNVINYPWILDCQSKSDILLIDSREKQKMEIDNQLINTVVHNPFGGPMD